MIRLLIGDALTRLRDLPDKSVQCVITSPPYFGLRDYEVAGQIGFDQTPVDYVAGIVEIFREIRRVLRNDGTVWLNLGDSYNTYPASRTPGRLHKNNHRALPARQKGYGLAVKGGRAKELLGIPWQVAFALQADGWFLRQDIIWSKPNPMPESVKDRCTKAHEYLFLLSKQAKYYFDQDAISEPVAVASVARLAQNVAAQIGSDRVPGKMNGTMKAVGRNDVRNKRSVWSVATQSFKGAHFATFPPALIEPCILAGCPTGGVVLDPFGGAGTTGLVALKHSRQAILIELNPKYAIMARDRIGADYVNLEYDL